MLTQMHVARSGATHCGRSLKHSTWYRIGTYQGQDAYWHPALGYAYEFDHGATSTQLVRLEQCELASIIWANDDCFATMLSDVEASHSRLREAMDADLRAHVDAIRSAQMSDEDFANHCAAERDAEVYVANLGLAHAALTERW